MLKTLAPLVFVLLMISCTGMARSPHGGAADYYVDVHPPCLITFNDDYWTWRDGQGVSRNEVQDLEAVYTRFQSLVEASGSPSVEKAMCDESLLFSPELARVMNSYGRNASPWTLYYRVVSSLQEAGRPRDATLGFAEFRQLLIASIREIEHRFEEAEQDAGDSSS